jgi:hypothetical protein
MLSYANDEATVKERFFRRIEEIWELNYTGEKVPTFCVRWAKSVQKEGRYFTTMIIPDASVKNASAKKSHGYSRAKLTNASKKKQEKPT